MIAASIGFLFSALLALTYTRRTLLGRPSITLILFVALLAIHVIPMLVYLNYTGPETFIYEAALRPVDGDAVKARLLWAMACMFIFVVAGSEFGFFVAPKKWRAKSRRANNGFEGSYKYTYIYEASTATRFVLWFIALLMLAVILFENQPRVIFDYFASGGSELSKILMRREEGGTKFYVYNVFLYSLAPFIVMVLSTLKRQRPGDLELRILFVFFFVLVFIGKLGTLSKAPVVIFLLQFAFFRALLSTARLNFWVWVRLLVFGLFMLTVVVKLTIPDIDLLDVYRFLYYRSFDIPNEGLLEFFAAFPHSLKHGWEYGIFGEGGRPANDLPTYFAVAELTRGDATSSSNVMFVGDAWAGYEWVGVIATSFLVGVTVRLIDLYAFRLGRSDEWACVIAAATFGVFTMLSTAFSTSLVTGGLMLIPFVSALFVRRRPFSGVSNEVTQAKQGLL